MKQPIRMPRPLGTTEMAMRYHNEPEPTKKQGIKEKLRKRFINLYLSDDLKDKEGKILSNNQLAYCLDMHPNECLIRITKEFSRLGALMNPADQNTARAIFFKAFQWALETKALTDTQTTLLMAAQKGKYVPFVSGEVNRAIANSIAANKPLLEILKLFAGQPNVRPNGTVADDQPQAQAAYLTTDTALALIQNEPSIVQDPRLIEAKEVELIGIPEVRATHRRDNSYDTAKRVEVNKPKPERTHDDTILDAEDMVG